MSKNSPIVALKYLGWNTTCSLYFELTNFNANTHHKEAWKMSVKSLGSFVEDGRYIQPQVPMEKCHSK